MKNKAIFLDRDGTINEDTGFVCRKEVFVFTYRAVEAIKILRAAGYRMIVVTNQSGIARGYFTLRDVKSLHTYINAELAKAGTKIDAFYVCPHRPEDCCECRKPKPALIWQAAERFNISLKDSWMVGDKPSDVECAKNAGVKEAIIGSSRIIGDCIAYETLYEFAKIIAL